MARSKKFKGATEKKHGSEHLIGELTSINSDTHGNPGNNVSLPQAYVETPCIAIEISFVL
jgi:hypothetical protein